MAPEVLANPSADLQEAPEISREALRERGIRPYDEKVWQQSSQHPTAQKLKRTVFACNACRGCTEQG